MNQSITTGQLSTAQVTNAALIGRAAEWYAAGHRLALAFVMQSWGSSPRPAGSVMLVREDMAVEGVVGGVGAAADEPARKRRRAIVENLIPFAVPKHLFGRVSPKIVRVFKRLAMQAVKFSGHGHSPVHKRYAKACVFSERLPRAAR